jgi:tryptophan synthase alpha chain
MQRIEKQFEKARSEGRACLVAYLCAGDPTFEWSLEACRRLLQGGIDILELGVPFSDPLADGPTNQMAAQRALDSGMTHQKVLDLVVQLRRETQIPIILYTYYNLIFAQGHKEAARQFAEAEVDGVLVLDLPPEEAGAWLAAASPAGLANILIVAPTTPPARIKRIAEKASGFIYYVSRTGVTGERQDLADDLAAQVEEIRRHTSLPIAVGFGISTGAQVRAVAAVADGVVVGSALVNCIARNTREPAKILSSLSERLAELRSGLMRQAQPEPTSEKP